MQRRLGPAERLVRPGPECEHRAFEGEGPLPEGDERRRRSEAPRPNEQHGPIHAIGVPQSRRIAGRAQTHSIFFHRRVVSGI